MSADGWTTLHDDGERIVRISPTGIVVVHDRVDGRWRVTRVRPDGRVGQATHGSRQNAWSLARQRLLTEAT